MDNSTHEDGFVEHLTNQQRDLYVYILTLLPRAQDADEVLQETNKVLWMKRADFREGTNFRAWAFRIAQFQVLSHRKRQRREHRLLSLDLVGQLADETAQPRDVSRSLVAILKNCVEKLSAASRELLKMRYDLDLSAPQIAEKTGRSPVAVRQALFTVRRDLTRCMKDVLDEKEETP
ncbi:MAG: sigma-70 family RNA polymerase sigma factor [Pirellulaceae bacterium]|nr:sigma-70 family RNA polymerase sigma factor [Pirellulaceae bacterium]